MSVDLTPSQIELLLFLLKAAGDSDIVAAAYVHQISFPNDSTFLQKVKTLEKRAKEVYFILSQYPIEDVNPVKY